MRHALLTVLVMFVFGGSAGGAEPASSRDARYELSYFGKTLGEESFSIRETPGGRGWVVDATIRTSVGTQAACESTYVLDADRNLVSATYRPLDGDGPSATYRVEGGVLIGEASNGASVRIDLAEGDLVAGPHYVTDFFVLHPLGLTVGDEINRTCHTFGFKDWTVTACDLEIRRAPDKRAKSPNGKVDTAVYKCRIDTGTKVFRTSSFIAADGVSVRLSVSAPIAKANVRLLPPAPRDG